MGQIFTEDFSDADSTQTWVSPAGLSRGNFHLTMSVEAQCSERCQETFAITNPRAAGITKVRWLHAAKAGPDDYTLFKAIAQVHAESLGLTEG